MKWFREWRAWVAHTRVEKEKKLLRECTEMISELKGSFPDWEKSAAKNILDHTRWVDKRNEL